MKKILLTSILLSLLILPTVTLATSPPPAPTLDVMVVLDRITNWLFAILLIVSAIAFIIAGYFFVTAGGDVESISKARSFVLYAIIGLIVAFAARGLVLLVERVVGR